MELKVTGRKVGEIAPVGHPPALRTLIDRELTKSGVAVATED